MFTTGAPRREPGGGAGHWSPTGLPVAYKAGRLPADKRVRSAPTHHTPAHRGVFPDKWKVRTTVRRKSTPAEITSNRYRR